ncbi:MAG: amino acid ABC transporter permease [Aestuariivirga sp.]|uniref:amino acid ABC transporter permease n=1 Tax=Aestuariivirga sp. TaxID=2650926 RepID=UPI0025C44F58|nr:amino acid ABC transporter permease [Aestuariivirga sp.]MCA3560512.1 amino acid ABC transporter permease [Aestuariivirga sp.]
MSISYVRDRDAPLRPPPAGTAGPIGWLRENLFSSPGNSLLTAILAVALGYLAWTILDWAILRAVWTGVDREACAIANAGACWPFAAEKFPQWLFGFYPIAERWRPMLAFLIGAAALVPMLMPWVGGKTLNALFLLFIYPVIAFELLAGGLLGLTPVETSNWGGLMVTLVVAVTGIVFSLPLGILLALGRRSELPVIRAASIAFIELWRGVPLVTVLFMASVMLPLILPGGVTPDKLLRAIAGLSLFASAYMAEAVRGGLQAVGKGQTEAGLALGLSRGQVTRKIVLPQALRISIPNIVGIFIGLFKDTTLVLVVSIYDFLGIVNAGMQDAKWAAPQTANTGYFAAAIVYFVFCFAMSRYALFTERRLAQAGRR